METLEYSLRKRAEIRRQIPTRKSVQEGAPDRIADLLEEAANELDRRQAQIDRLMLEFCPNEMSKEQMDVWAANQRAVRYAQKYLAQRIEQHPRDSSYEIDHDN